MPQLEVVVATDFDEMVALRIDALRESLERLGRFDPTRARERLAAGFVPECMHHIVKDGLRVGFITLGPTQAETPDAVRLPHLYIRPAFQGHGLGAWALNWAKQEATRLQRDITLSALKQSDANRFYLRHGFVEVGESEFDVDYRWSHSSRVRA